MEKAGREAIGWVEYGTEHLAAGVLGGRVAAPAVDGTLEAADDPSRKSADFVVRMGDESASAKYIACGAIPHVRGAVAFLLEARGPRGNPFSGRAFIVLGDIFNGGPCKVAVVPPAPAGR